MNELLNNDLNIDIYEILKKNYGDLDPRQFLDSIAADVEFFCSNYSNYHLIEQHFEDCKYSGKNRYFYYYSIWRLVENQFDADEFDEGVLSKTYGLIKKYMSREWDNIPREPKTVKDGFGFWFSDLKSFLESIDDFDERRRILINLKYECQQIVDAVGEMAPRNYHTFVNDCDLELKKLNELELIGLPRESNKMKLSLRQIALMYCYEDEPIGRGEVANTIAHEYGHKSGDKLYQYFSFYYDRRHRINLIESSTDLSTLESKIQLMESVKELLIHNLQAQSKLASELELLIKSKN
ncbi:MAG: hypothetical protein ACXVJN_04285 [Mucilaginibacter sp.]